MFFIVETAQPPAHSVSSESRTQPAAPSRSTNRQPTPPPYATPGAMVSEDHFLPEQPPPPYDPRYPRPPRVRK